MRQRHRTWLIALGAIIALAMSVACGGDSSEQVRFSADKNDDLPSCHMVSHIAGETCVPDNPQRIVDLAGLDYALSLGIKPIASDSGAQDKFHLQDGVDGIEDVGGDDTPNFERILELKPDLIIGGSYLNVSYKLLSNIAPTVVIQYDYSGQWKDVFMQYAVTLSKTEEAEQVMERYYERAQEFQRQMGSRAAETSVSVVRVYPTQVNLYLADSFCGTVIADAGLSRPPSQSLTASEAANLFGNQIQYEVSKEKIPDMDGDAIFLWTFGHHDEIAQNSQSAKEELKADPLWSTLTAVQQDNVYEVPGEYWIGDGPIAANAVLDDLFKYLLEES